MRVDSLDQKTGVERPSEAEIARREKELNEIIPVLAHGLMRQIEQKGFSGKVRVRAVAGDNWGVAKDKNNPTDIPNIIIYPRESLGDDSRLVNARLRHEIGNLNYPIEGEVNNLRKWCEEKGVAPVLVTSLVESVHEASVNFMEMRNSFSDNPAENFAALYEQEVDTQKIADEIKNHSPYKQAVDLTLLYCLSQAGLISSHQYRLALETSSPEVRQAFDPQVQSILDQAVKIAVPRSQVQLIRDYVWPKFSHLVALAKPKDGEFENAKLIQKEVQRVRDELNKVMEKIGEQEKKKESKKQEAKKEAPKMPKQNITPEEAKERQAAEDMLTESMKEQLENIKEQLEQAKPSPKGKEKSPSSMEEIATQAEQMQDKAEQALKEAKEQGADEQTLEDLLEQLKQLEEIAKQLSEEQEVEEEIPEEPIRYNIQEIGINEAELNEEQLKNLNRVRQYAESTSRSYRTAMRMIMKGYQQRNPNFTDKIMTKMMERGYDVPSFTIFGSQAGNHFLSEQEELGIEALEDENFVVNFQLPKPLSRFWYKGGNGAKSVPVKDGEIEWGHFYRMGMPIIWNAADRAAMSGLYLNRLNSFGQHDPKKYYYLYEAIGYAQPEYENEDSENQSDDQEQRQGENSESQEGQNEEGDNQEGEGGQGEGSGESGEQSHNQFQKGGNSNERDVDNLFSNPDSELLKELSQTEEMIGSKFSEEDEDGNITSKDMSDFMADSFEEQNMERNPAHAAQLETLEEIKRQQQSKIESMYREMSGLDGEALRIYIDHMEGMKDFINDLTDFFVEKFDLDKEYLYERNQRRGARLQRGYTKNILGMKGGRPSIDPRSFERKRPPEKPQFAWSLIIDNSGSCGGEIIEQEKRLAVALIEVSKRLDIPLEIVTFGGVDQFTFLKTFEQDLMGADLQKTVLLNADQGTPDVVTLDAACTSMEKYADQFNRSYNFVYFMTDGQSGEGSIQEVIRRHKREMVITGIGLDSAAQTISQTWGNNAIAVPDVSKLSEKFIRKMEDQIDQTFD